MQEKMMTVITMGIDVGKTWSHLIGFDTRGAIVARERFNRGQLLRYMSKIDPALVGMEASCGSHHLARDLIGLGHDARLIGKVRAVFVKGNKNDYLDAEAIAEAVQRPTMRIVLRLARLGSSSAFDWRAHDAARD